MIVTLEVVGASVRAEAPAPLTKSPGWKVVPLPATSDAKGWRQTFHLAPLKPGSMPLVVEPLKYRVGVGDWKHAHWRPIAVDVVSQADAESLKTPRDITAVETVPQTSTKFSWVWWGLPLVVGSMGLAIYVFLRGRRRPPARGGAGDLALRHLERLRSLPYLKRAQIDRYFTRLDRTLRRYLARRHQIRAPQMTTAELLRALSPGTDWGRLPEFFAASDLVRFAQDRVTVEQAESWRQTLVEWIRQDDYESCLKKVNSRNSR